MAIRYFTFLLISFIFLTSCKVTKNLKDNELLITKSTIEYKKAEETKNERKFKTELNAVIKPQPNPGLFKLPVKIYQWAEKSKKKKGFKRWMQRNFGQAPAIYDEQVQVINRLRMKKLLKDNGFFNSDIQLDTLVKGKKVEMTYLILTKGQHKVNDIFLPSDTTAIGRLVRQNQAKSLIKKDDFYAEILLAQERLRLSNVASQQGYLDFDDNYIYYFVDTIPGEFLTNIYIKVKPPTSGKPHQKYRLGKTIIYPNYDLSNNTFTKKDTLQFKSDRTIIENNHLIKHQVLDRMILQSEGDVIVKRYQDVSVNHLLDLGIFKFVNLKYERQGDSLQPILDRVFYLTPNFNQNISANFELNNRTGDFYGIGASATYRHKNVFKKALTLSSSISGGVETQIGNTLSFLNTIDLNAEVELAAPRFILPFKVKPNSGLFVPRTTLSLGNNFQGRVSLYSINSTNLKFGYQWKETSEKQHTLYPLSINRVQVLNKTAAFENLISTTPRLTNSFQNSFIAGLDYTYIFTNQSANVTKDYWFFKGNARTSGNLLQLAAKTFNFPKNNLDQFEIIQSPFAQFTSLEADLRYYKISNNNTFAFRFSPAVGFAYGNSEVLPYIEQFFVGGANGIRAFRLRDLGPGSFARQSVASGGVEQQFLDQTGDIKLEMTAEWRFPILGFFKGAAFVDAGNVWLLSDDATLGEKFAFDTFWKEIAMGGGLGFRVDIDFIVLRLDVAMPFRSAYFGDGFQWSFDKIDFGNRNWRQDNIVYNLAVGYPF